MRQVEFFSLSRKCNNEDRTPRGSGLFLFRKKSFESYGLDPWIILADRSARLSLMARSIKKCGSKFFVAGIALTPASHRRGRKIALRVRVFVHNLLRQNEVVPMACG
jgi:hypothetical protein